MAFAAAIPAIMAAAQSMNIGKGGIKNAIARQQARKALKESGVEVDGPLKSLLNRKEVQSAMSNAKQTFNSATSGAAAGAQAGWNTGAAQQAAAGNPFAERLTGITQKGVIGWAAVAVLGLVLLFKFVSPGGRRRGRRNRR